MPQKFACACCGYLTMDEPAGSGSYDICPVCAWEDDSVQFKDPTYAGGANKPSLQEARKNFAAFGAHSEECTKMAKSPAELGVTRDPDWKE